MMIMMIFIFGALIVLGLIVGFIYLLDYRAQRRYEQENTSRMINYIETHNIIDSLSPYFKNYTFRHQIDRSYYDFEDSLKKDIDRIIAVYGKQYNFNCYSQDLYQAMKKLISFYREQLLKNYHLGKEYQTSKGLIRVVPIHNSVPNGESLWVVQTAPPDSPYGLQYEDQTRIDLSCLNFCSYRKIPPWFFELTSKYGFICTVGRCFKYTETYKLERFYVDAYIVTTDQ